MTMTDRPISRFKLRQAKRANAYFRERLVRRGLERTAKMMESFNSEWTTVYGDMLDRFRNHDMSQFSAATNANDRRYGKNFPIVQTEQDLAMLRMPSRILCATNNYAIGLLTGLTSYVIGDGYKYRATPIPGMEDVCPKELTASCQTILDDFAKINDWNGGEQPGLEAELFWRSCEDGEFFLRLFPQEDGRTFVRTVEPEQVTKPPEMSYEEGLFGVITPPNDAQDVRGYYVFYGVDISNGSIVHKDEIVHLRRNVKRSIKRGIPDFSFSSYDTLMLADKLRRAIGLGASIQASIAWVRQHDAATADQVQSAIESLDNKDWSATNPNTGKEDRYARFEPGTILDVDKGQTYVPPPPAGANGTAHLAILQMLAQAGGNRWNAPAWLATADNTSANYATALTEESPFVKTVTCTQPQYKGAFVRPYWFALQHFVQTRGGIIVNVKRGEMIEQRRYMWDDIKRLVDIQVEAHSPEVRNKMEEAQANQIRIQGGWKSPQTVQAEEGLDSDREKTNILEWRDEMGSVGQQLPAGSADPFGGSQGNDPEPRPTPESRLLEAKDASGHEHAADGKFGTGGTKKDDAKPKHGERAAAAHSKYHELIAQAKAARVDAFNSVKADAQAAHAKVAAHAKEISKALGNVAWDTDWDEAFNDLDTEISYRPDESAPAKERYDSFKSIEDAAKAALEHSQETKKTDDDRLTFDPDEIKANKAALKAIISHAREARTALKAYVQHRKEMAAIKSGDNVEVKESLAAEAEDWAAVLESFDETKVKRDGGKFAKVAGAGKKDDAKPNSPAGSDKPAETKPHTLKGIADIGSRVLSGALDMEHGAKEIVKAQFEKLPGAVKAPVAGFLKVFYGTYLIAQDAVNKVAKAKGIDEQGRHRLASVVCAIDAVGMKANAIAGSAVSGPIGGTVASFVPVASLSYLAFSAVKNPKMVMEQCTAAVKDYMGRKKKEQPHD